MPPDPSLPDTPPTRSRASAGLGSLHVPAASKRARAAARIERRLGLRRGELRLALLLFAYLFLAITACTIGGSYGNALFLSRFPAVRLPYADLAAGAAVMTVMAGYLRIGRSTPLRNLVVASLFAFAAVAALFWWLVQHFPSAWLSSVVYVWVGIVGALAPMQVWTLANCLLTLRQAKRVFAIVGSGSILGWICGGALTRAVTRARGADNLLLIMALAFCVCVALVPVIARGAPAARRTGTRRTETRGGGESGLRGAAAMVWNSPYLKLIAVLLCLASFLASMTKWQFLAIAQASLPQKDDLAAFQGSFGSVAGIVALLVQLALTAPILRRVGLGGALAFVPFGLAIGSFGLLAFGSLAAVVVLRGSDQVLRYSIDRSAKELLYLPIPRAQAVHAKSFLDTVVSRFGDALASVVILSLALARGVAPPRLAWLLAWLTLALVAVWLVATRSVHRLYLRNLADALRQNRVDVQGVTGVLDRATTELLASNLGKGESKRVLSALSLVEASRAPSVLPKVEALMSHPSAAVRARAVAVLSASRPRNPPSSIEPLLFDPDLRVRSAALLYMAHAGLDPLARMREAGEFDDLSVRSAMVVYLARGGKAQNVEACRELLEGMVHERGPDGRKVRLEAARLLASLPNLFKDQLAPLLADEDADVARHAIRAVGRLRASRFVPQLIDALASPPLSSDARGALARFSHRIVHTLAVSLADPQTKIEARREIPKALLRIGSPSAEQALVENLGARDGALRFDVVSALNQLKRRHPEPPVDPSVLDKALEVEILGHYRAYLSPPPPHPEGVSAEETNRQLECIFRLLQLRLPGRDINSAYVGIQSADPVVHDKALEFLDNILAPHLRKMLVPLVDSNVEREERAAIAGRLCATV